MTFHRTYQISLGRIAFISTAFFFTQLLVDLFCAKYVDRIGYRRSVIASEVFSASGLIGLAFLPSLLPDPYVGILISVIIYAIGSGLIEVLVSPIVEACPFDNKDSVMSLLHSFISLCRIYSWHFKKYWRCDTPTRVLANWGFLRHGRTPQRAITSPLHPVTSLPLSRLFCGCLF